MGPCLSGWPRIQTQNYVTAKLAPVSYILYAAQWVCVDNVQSLEAIRAPFWGDDPGEKQYGLWEPQD